MARFFIERPIFAIVIAIMIVIAGTIAGLSLPIAQYPQIQPPTVSVSATYTGANAEVVNQTVAQVLEEQINGVQGMNYMSSNSDDSGAYNLEVVFDLGVDGDIAAVKVQNSVAQANATLPAEVTAAGITTKKASSDMATMLSFFSPKGTYDNTFLTNYFNVYLRDAIKRVNGVGDVMVFGAEFSRRIWINPDRMAELGLTVADVIEAVKEQNVQAPAGTIGAMPVPKKQEFQYTAKVRGRLTSIADFENIIVKAQPNGSFVYLKDIARIENAGKELNYTTKQDGANAVAVGIQLTSDANAMNTIQGVKQAVAAAAVNLPPDMKYLSVFDNTDYISESVSEVIKTFLEAMALVMIIVFIFLQSWRATLIPMLAVPVSLIGTFGAFIVLGFSINTLTLFAMVLAIGLVVDDAIVVIEAVEHHIRYSKLTPVEATKRAMDEVSGPVIAIAFVLAAVFIPVAFIGGMVGVLYRQFALTIAVSMALSAVVALSLTPALCALLLEPHKEQVKTSVLGQFFGNFNDWFDRTISAYSETVKSLISKAKYCCIFLLIILVGTVYLYKIVPTTFVPDEDQGFFATVVNLPEGASMNRTQAVTGRLVEEIKVLPGVNQVISVDGYDMLSNGVKPNASVLFVGLEPWSKRKDPATQIDSLITQVYSKTGLFPEASIMAFNIPSLPGLGMIGGFTMVLQDMSGHSKEELDAITKKFVLAANQLPEVTAVYSTYKSDSPGYEFEVDREKVKNLGIALNDVFTALQVNFGGSQVNDFNMFNRTYKVVMQADTMFRNEADMTRFIYVRSSNGSMIPLDTLLKPKLTTGPSIISRFNAARSIQINGSVGAGYSSGQALAAMEKLAKETLPAGFSVEWSGQSREEKKAGSKTMQILAMALVFVFLCLAALYESWSVPYAVMLSVPTGIFGALLSQFAMNLQNSVYMQIGVIMLIGLAAKNAILIVEFAKVRVDKGMDPVKAAIEAAALRLRPILMTSFAFIIGCLPLAMASGAGAGARKAMGTAVVGGMTVATAFGIFLIPVLFVVVEWIVAKLHWKKKKKEAYSA
ncbi:Efflux pump membrane transporter BepE [Sporomusa ovata DSM 2662]|uniref:RND efflux system, inner membrane transporter CmeB n=1 Tax=Sporomusa ovata TaxID=2378 RepID=A0A0U1L1N2_9FIRM|nr:multidrug efflux RND transporter permease subunit [Sporomusa ovata]EQB25016.1 transporter, hydrophobe/amphiphile efflux-1 HAE1 family [Sporomusa ovata DSM 2662]CQR73561.1 RND efflux system, inner membrane transporter CmeB [Sporomusa ovata]